MKPSMFCETCRVWTKEYKEDGDHTCGTEVKSSTLDSGNPDLDFEGTVPDKEYLNQRSGKAYGLFF